MGEAVKDRIDTVDEMSRLAIETKAIAMTLSSSMKSIEVDHEAAKTVLDILVRNIARFGEACNELQPPIHNTD